MPRKKRKKPTPDLVLGASTPKDPLREEVKRWQARLVQADKAYQDWSDKYQTGALYDFYLGHQVPDNLKTGSIWNDPYVLNLIFPTIDAALPSLLFYKPVFQVRPRATRLDDPTSRADQRAKLRQDTLNTFIQDDDVGFDDSVPLSILEGFFRFGVVEVGYSADYVDNPNARKPVLRQDGQEMKDGDGKPIPQPPKLAESERLFIKRIPAKQFRVGVNAQTALRHNDWVGYYEWQYTQDVKNNKAFENTGDMKAGGQFKERYTAGEDAESKAHEAMVRVWRIWDLRAGVKWTLAEGHDLPLRKDEGEDGFLTDRRGNLVVPVATYRPHPILDEFYSLPPCFNWIPPQLEYSEARQQQRMHRRRFERKYTYVEGTIDEGEVDKLLQGGDGTTVKALQRDPLQPVPDAPLSGDAWRGLSVTKDDFREITGKGGEQRGISDSQTATQAAIIDTGAKLRDSFAKAGPWGVAKFLTDIARLVLLTIEQRLALEYWVLTNVDPKAPGSFQEAMEIAQTWREITSKELGDLDYDVTLDVESITPPMSEKEADDRWVQLQPLLFANPGQMVAYTQSETLLKKTLRTAGIRSPAEIAEVRKAMEAVLHVLAGTQTAPGGGPGGGPPGVASPAGLNPTPGPQPDQAEVMNSLGAQMMSPGGTGGQPS